MMRHLVAVLALLFMVTAGFPLGMGTQAPDESHAEADPEASAERSPAEALDMLERQPAVFTANMGQLGNDDVRFYTKGGSMWFTSDGVWFDVRDEDGDGGVVLKQEFRGGNDVAADDEGLLSLALR